MVTGGQSSGRAQLAATASTRSAPESRRNTRRSPVVASTAAMARSTAGHSGASSLAANTARRADSGTVSAASARAPTRRRQSARSRVAVASSPNIATISDIDAAGVRSSPGSGASVSRRYDSAAGRPPATQVPTSEPADVPMTRSASPTSAPAEASPASTPVSQAIPASPPPPSTSARLTVIGGSLRSSGDGYAADLGHAVQRDAEPFAVGGEHLIVVAERLFDALAVHRTDEVASAERDPPGLGEHRADEGPGEVRLRRRPVPPAPRREVRELARPPLQPVLRPAVLEDVEVAVGGLGDAEDAPGVDLVAALVQAQWVMRVTAEADVGEPGPDAQRHVVVRHAEPVAAEHPGGQHVHLEPERREQRRERAVQLVTEAA